MLPSFLLTLSVSIATIEAYKIDSASCGDDAPWLNSALYDAFDMAKKASEAIDAPTRDPNVNRLIDLLFCEEGDDPATVDLSSASASFSGVSSMSTMEIDLDKSTSEGTEMDFVSSQSRIRSRDMLLISSADPLLRDGWSGREECSREMGA